MSHSCSERVWTVTVSSETRSWFDRSRRTGVVPVVGRDAGEVTTGKLVPADLLASKGGKLAVLKSNSRTRAPGDGNGGNELLVMHDVGV